jgi:hypothetical protein
MVVGESRAGTPARYRRRVDVWLASAITGATAIVAAAVGARAVYHSSRAERRERERSELVAALAEYIATVDALTMQLGRVPVVKPSSSKAGRVLDRAAEGLERLVGEAQTQMLREMLQPRLMRRLEELTDRFWMANARLQLVASREVRDVMNEVTDVIGPWSETPGAAYFGTWTPVRLRLGRVARAAAGNAAGELPEEPALERPSDRPAIAERSEGVEA